MNEPTTTFDWADLAFGDKKPLKSLRAIFIAAPREISDKRFRQLVQTYLPQGNIVLGLAKEQFVDGFAGQPQFRTLRASTIASTIAKVNAASNKQRIYTLTYAQRELPYILEKSAFSRVVLVNGSWRHTFHTLPAYYVLARASTPYDMVSPFASEQEAQTYETRIMKEIGSLHPFPKGAFSAAEMLTHAQEVAAYSFDYSHQTGVALGKRGSSKYRLLAWTYNRVVPQQTYALQHGASREQYFSPPNDLNHYDTVHAEVELLITAQKQGISLKGTTLFINLLPCPACARMFCETDIEEFVYSLDHSDGYAVRLLETAGKKVRRVVL